MNSPVPVDELARKRLERDIAGLLRALPEIAAPASLEQRVLARIALEERLPWYRRGFSRWPGAARVLFLPVALAGAAITMGLASRIGAALPSPTSLPSAARANATWSALRDAAQMLGNLITHAVPAQWLYAAAGVAVAAYLMTFLLGTVAYRMLLPHPHRT